MSPPAPERVTTDGLGRWEIIQPRQGHRFSIDSVLLAFFAPPLPGPVADLGAGCGVLCLLLAARGLAGPFHAIEIDPLAADCCQANLARHGLAGRVFHQDLAAPLPDLPAASQALVISNPPFGRAGQGRVPPDPARAQARHELALAAADLWATAGRLLPPGGRFALCLPPRRLAEGLAGLTQARLTPKRLRLVHGREGKPASLALIEAVKDGGEDLVVEPPLVVYGQGQTYGPEVAAIYAALE